MLLRFRNRIVSEIPALNSDPNRIENLRRILARKIYDQEKAPMKDIAKLKKRIKFKTKFRMSQGIVYPAD